MHSLSKTLHGYLFTAVGSLFALAGAGMLLVQLATGEWMFDSEVNGKPVGQKPLGVEFASMFLAMGLAFAFIGLAQAARTPRVRVIFYGLCGAQFALVALTVGALVLGMCDVDVGLPLLIAWPVVLLLGVALAARHPDFKHAAATQSKTLPVHDPLKPPIRSSTFSAADSAALPAKAWKTALISAGLAGLFPVLFFGIFFLAAVPDKDPVAIVFVGIFILVSGLFFAVPTFGLVLLVQFMARNGSGNLTQAYQAFAARVGGEVVLKKLPFFGIETPQAVLLSHGKIPCVLDLEVVSSGEDSTTYTRMTFELPAPAPLSCRVTPQGLLGNLASLLGAQDVRLGWDKFDDQFIVKVSDELLVRHLLSRGVQEQLLALKTFAYEQEPANVLGTGHADLSIQEQRVQIRIRASLGTEKDLFAFFQAGTGMFDELVRHLQAPLPASPDRAPPGWG